MIRRAVLCLALFLASALPIAAEQRQRPHGLFSTSTSRNFSPRPPRSIRRVAPRPRSAAARSRPAAPARSQAPTAATGPAPSPDFPPVQILESSPAAPARSPAFPPTNFPPVQTLE